MIVAFAAILLLLLLLFAIVRCLIGWVDDDFDPKSLRGKRVIVTGSTSGIGEGIALEYAKAGARLVLTARREHVLRSMVARCLEAGALQADYVVCDMQHATDRHRLVVEARRLLGGLDHLILDHALFFFEYFMGTEQHMADLHQLLDVNFIAYVDIASRCMDMLAESHGNIGVLSSVDGKMPLMKCSTHTLTKFALQGFFLMLRQELQHKRVPVSVTLNIMGPVATIYDPNMVTYFGMRPCTVQQAARAIARAVAKQVVEAYHPASAKCAVWLHKLFPRTVEKYNNSAFSKITEFDMR